MRIPIDERRDWWGRYSSAIATIQPLTRNRVLSFSERLREDGYETSLDQYVNGFPAEGWPRWMLDQIDKASFVLIVCTETYYRRFRGHEKPGWERASTGKVI